MVPGGRGTLSGGAWSPPPTATAAGGTHPTGMHSCYLCAERGPFHVQHFFGIFVCSFLLILPSD